MVVELEPQEDAMVRSLSLLCAKDTPPTPSIFSGQFFVLGALGILIVCPQYTFAQSDATPDSSKQVDQQGQICDELKQNDPHHLSLSIAGRQSSMQGTSDLTEDIKFPEITNSNRMTPGEALLCKKKTAPSGDPAPQTNQSTKPVINPTGSTVSYNGNELTIHAENVPLRDVLEAIQARAGVAVVFPSEAMDDSVFDHLGPAPVQDVLAQLLYGSGYNYVIQTSSQNPQIVTKVVLSAQNRIAASGQPQHASSLKNEQADNQALYGGAGIETQVAVEPMPPVPVANPLIGIPAGFNVQQAATASGKTPGQILDELQKQQMQALDSQNPQP
jgi:hypothetical protein